MDIKKLAEAVSSHDVGCECPACITLYKEIHYGPFASNEEDEDE